MNNTRAFMLQTFGYNDFLSLIQEQAVESILGPKKSNNFLINMVVRGGKSLCYQLPGNLNMLFKIMKF